MNLSMVLSLFASISGDFQYNCAVAIFGLVVAKGSDGRQVLALMIFFGVSMIVDICNMTLDDKLGKVFYGGEYQSKVVFGIV